MLCLAILTPAFVSSMDSLNTQLSELGWRVIGPPAAHGTRVRIFASLIYCLFLISGGECIPATTSNVFSFSMAFFILSLLRVELPR